MQLSGFPATKSVFFVDDPLIVVFGSVFSLSTKKTVSKLPPPFLDPRMIEMTACFKWHRVQYSIASRAGCFAYFTSKPPCNGHILDGRGHISKLSNHRYLEYEVEWYNRTAVNQYVFCSRVIYRDPNVGVWGVLRVHRFWSERYL